jgi:hypothetical protein
MGTKISIVENLVFVISLVKLLWLIRFVVVATAAQPAEASMYYCCNYRLG